MASRAKPESRMAASRLAILGIGGQFGDDGMVLFDLVAAVDNSIMVWLMKVTSRRRFGNKLFELNPLTRGAGVRCRKNL